MRLLVSRVSYEMKSFASPLFPMLWGSIGQFVRD